jgi:DNA-binding transcriptional LysR family regulator
MIEITKLQIFIHAAETLSFSEAAKRTNLTQPTVSHHIKKLEQEVGAQLFMREGNNLKITEAGRLLLPWARKLIRQAISLQDLMSSVNEMIVGHLRIACSTTAGKYLLPLLAARFREHNPGINVSILRCLSEQVTSQILEGDANLAVVSHEAFEQGMELQEFFTDHVSLIAPANHPWASLESIQPDDLLDEPIILREPTSGTRKVLLSELAKFDISYDDLNIFLELGNAEAIVETVAAGYGVSFVSRLATACNLQNKDVVEVLIEGVDLTRKIYMIRKEIDKPNRALEAFWSFVHIPENRDLLEMAESPC